MAVSMEPVTSRSASTPAPMPLAMPVQDLSQAAPGRSRRRASATTMLARCITFGGAAALTVYAGREMVAVISVGGVTWLQIVMIVLFTVTFGWIAISACGALTGFLFAPRKARGAGPEAPHRTALVMPICNEDPSRSFASLGAMGMDLQQRGAAEQFEIFILSDTSKPEIWIKETAALARLKQSLHAGMRVWYRRRSENLGRKAGNIGEFVTRWGGRYDFMIVLDADSILTADTLLALVGAMQADPDLGLLQTAPRLCGGTTLFARLQQFAGTVYGPIVARSVCAWQGDDGNYWGHNAILRVRAFAEAAGLPELPGRKPFGGQILSHDFVEAALLRRAGWSVRMAPDLAGSWEESPPSLLDTAARDRRWAQGNIQHLAVIGSRGLAFMSRAHLAIGVMSYMASPLWLALLGTGLAVAFQAQYLQLEYFGDEPTLFPRWAVFDSERMLGLFLLSMGVLLLPKCLGVVRSLLSRELRKSVGLLRVVSGAALELLLSALYAPVLMLTQTRQIWEILRGQDSGWAVQNRHSSAVDWRMLRQRHGLQTLLGVVAAVILAWFSLPLLAWMAPALLGLVLAIPLSAASASTSLGAAARRLGLLLTPEEVAVPSVIEFRDRLELDFAADLEAATLEALLADDQAWDRHSAAVDTLKPYRRGQPDVSALSAHAKIADAQNTEEALSWLTARELLAVLGDSALFEQLKRAGQAQAQPPPPLRILQA
jgi:membrane glycosyltransferase